MKWNLTTDYNSLTEKWTVYTSNITRPSMPVRDRVAFKNEASELTDALQDALGRITYRDKDAKVSFECSGEILSNIIGN